MFYYLGHLSSTMLKLFKVMFYVIIFHADSKSFTLSIQKRDEFAFRIIFFLEFIHLKICSITRIWAKISEAIKSTSNFIV